MTIWKLRSKSHQRNAKEYIISFKGLPGSGHTKRTCVKWILNYIHTIKSGKTVVFYSSNIYENIQWQIEIHLLIQPPLE